MSGSQGSVVVIDAMSFRRARDEFFLAPWATEEKLDLISIMPTEVHSTLGEHINCRMLIYDIGGVSAASHEILLEIHVLRTLFPAAALVIFSDDEGKGFGEHPLRAVLCATEMVTAPCRFQTGAGLHTGFAACRTAADDPANEAMSAGISPAGLVNDAPDACGGYRREAGDVVMSVYKYGGAVDAHHFLIGHGPLLAPGRLSHGGRGEESCENGG